jgi:hypothetical protein
MSDVVTPEVVQGDDLRARMQKLVRTVGESTFELAKQLYRVKEGRLYEAWGWRTFIDYLAGELEIGAKTAYQYISVYLTYQPVWERAQLVPWHRLVEAIPLVNARVQQPEQLVLRLAEPTSTVLAIRQWKTEQIPLKTVVVSSKDEKPDYGGAPAYEPGDEENQLQLHPDMTVLRFWHSQKDSRPWVAVQVELPVAVVSLVTEAALLARRVLQRRRNDNDDRISLQHELEAVCQEVIGEWAAALAEEDRR